MRSFCMAALPHTPCRYTWKVPVTPQMRPVLVDQAHHTSPRAGSRLRRDAAQPEQSAIPWKAYLASREFKNLASDIADAVFSPSSTSLSFIETERPSSLTARNTAQTAGQPSAGSLLTSVLQDRSDAPRDKAEKQAPGFALAA